MNRISARPRTVAIVVLTSHAASTWPVYDGITLAHGVADRVAQLWAWRVAADRSLVARVEARLAARVDSAGSRVVRSGRRDRAG
jgi:hypothetical protein